MTHVIEQLLRSAGITPNGPNPWDIQVHHKQFYNRILKDPTLELGESYMDEWWDCAALDEFIFRLIRANLTEKIKASPILSLKIIWSKILNFQTKREEHIGIRKHYNTGNELFEKMLGKTMNYSCGYWKNAHYLDEAQSAKMELICRKLMLKPGQKILDVGCGWGGFAKYASEKYQVEVVGLTLSSEQKKYADNFCKDLPVTIIFGNYRDFVSEPFDRIVSIGMFEHVGYKNYRDFMKFASQHLKNDGIFLLHTIGSATPAKILENRWIAKYIFQNGMLPCISQIGKAIDYLFVMEDWHNFGAYYDPTLMSWNANFNKYWPELKNHYDNRFYRMWNFYLLSCAGAFRARYLQLWQIVMTKDGMLGGFHIRDL